MHPRVCSHSFMHLWYLPKIFSSNVCRTLVVYFSSIIYDLCLKSQIKLWLNSCNYWGQYEWLSIFSCTLMYPHPYQHPVIRHQDLVTVQWSWSVTPSRSLSLLMIWMTWSNVDLVKTHQSTTKSEEPLVLTAMLTKKLITHGKEAEDMFNIYWLYVYHVFKECQKCPKMWHRGMV